MKLTKEQARVLSGYFADISKVVLVSTVVNFFVPSDIAEPIPFVTAAIGAVLTLFTLIVSVYLVK